MGKYISVTVAFGWVIDRYDGDFVLGVPEDVDLGQVRQALEIVHPDVDLETFGYDFSGTALVVKESVTIKYDWHRRFEEYIPDYVQTEKFEDAARSAVNSLGWDVRRLGPPEWLLLVQYA